MMMSSERITAGASAILDTIDHAMKRQGIDPDDSFAMTTVAFVEMIGRKLGPHGLVEFLRDLSDEVEADNFKRIA